MLRSVRERRGEREVENRTISYFYIPSTLLGLLQVQKAPPPPPPPLLPKALKQSKERGLQLQEELFSFPFGGVAPPTEIKIFKGDMMAETASAPNSSSETSVQKSGFFRVPGLFVRLSTKGLLDSESIWSPTSPLDSKVYSVLGSTIVSSPRSPGPYGPQSKRLDLDCNRVGLGLVGSLNDESLTASGGSRKVLLGPEMRVNVPSSKTCLDIEENSFQAPVSPCYELGRRESVLESKLSEPIDQYVPNNPHFSSHSPPVVGCCINVDNVPNSNLQPMLGGVSDGFICNQSMNEITQSEEYTCIISHGPGLKTTHIFCDRVLETRTNGSPIEDVEGSLFVAEPSQDLPIYPCTDIFSFCCSCNKKLNEGKDIYIYLGEKAFCSPECRETFIMEEEPMRDTLGPSKPNYRNDCLFEPVSN